MGTLQSELSKVNLDSLQFDDDPSAPTAVAVVTASSDLSQAQQYWEWIRQNPERTAREVADAFGKPQLHVATVITKLWQRGLLSRREHEAGRSYRYTVCVAAYPRVTTAQRVASMLAARAARSKRKEKAAAPAPAAAVAAPVSIDAYVDSLTIAQARQLFDRLSKMFGR
jgi:predicted transcriptional regulator